MLLLGRRVGEEIVLPSCGVTIKVVAIKGKSVRLGFSAPPDVMDLARVVPGMVCLDK